VRKGNGQWNIAICWWAKICKREDISIREGKSSEAGHIVLASDARPRSNQGPTAQAVSACNSSTCNFISLRLPTFQKFSSKYCFFYSCSESWLRSYKQQWDFSIFSQKKFLHLILLRREKLTFMERQEEHWCFLRWNAM
jgi:hypothetical protein